MSDVPSNLIPTRITGLPEYLGTSTLGYLPYVIEGNTYKVQFANIAAVGAVPSTRQINTGSGLGGGGDLSANRTLFILPGGVNDSMLTTTGVTAGTYGSAENVAVLTVNAQGRVTSATNTPIVLSNYVPTSRTITAGTGLSGGGDLSANRSFAVNFSSTTPEPLGPGSPGVSTVAARGDHVHPAVDLSDTTETQGVLPLSRGGTGNSLSPVVGAIAYSSNDALYLTPTAGNAGQVLVSAGGLAPPFWQTITGAGTVTSVNASGGTTGLSFTGGPITTSGTLTLGGTLAVANGGTGASVAGAARTNLGAAASGANTDITSIALTTGTISASPVSGTDIVNKLYADSIASGINFHQSVRLATAAALPANTYSNGASGVGATLTATANGALSVDGVAAVVGNRILVKNEVTQANNGVYTATQVGNGSTPYILTRATDFDSSGSGVDQIDAGDFFLVTAGSTQANTSWVQQTPLPITVGTTAIVFSQFAAPVLYSAGTGLTLAGTVFSVTNTGVAASTYGSASSVPVLAINAQGQVTSASSSSIAIAASQITSGVLPVVNGGTGVTTSTGTGSVVLSSSPTLVTPTLGAASATSITNGLGSVGAPSYTFTGDTNTGIYSPAADTIAFVEGGVEAMRLDASGNLGLGVTPSAWGSTWKASQVSVSALANNFGSSASLNLVNNVFFDSAGASRYIGTGFATRYVQTYFTGEHQWFNAPSGTAGDVATLTERMRIDASGNVGIGTSSPTSGAGFTTITLNGGANGSIFDMQSSGTTYARALSNSSFTRFGTETALPLLLQTSATERMRITSAGLVGIGTSSPSTLLTAKLDQNATTAIRVENASTGVSAAASLAAASDASSFEVYNFGSGRITDGTNQYNNGASAVVNYNGVKGLVLAASNSAATGSDGISFWTANAGNAVKRMTLDSSGNVGIGTSSPLNKLQVNGANVGIRLSDTSGTTDFHEIQSGGVNGQNLFIDADRNNVGSGNMIFRVAGATERMRIDSSGNVGIGASSANSKLYVYDANAAISTNEVAAAGSGVASNRWKYSTNHYGIYVGSVNAMVFYDYGASAERMRIDSSGRVAIGATSAGTQLEVNGAGTFRLATSTNTLGFDFGYLGGPTDANGYVYNRNNGAVVFGTNNTERFRILSTGGITSADLADAVGYKGVPQNSQTSAYTLALSDIGKHISITTGGVVIPANGSVAFPIGATIAVYNNSASNQTISITTDTMYLAGTATTGSRTLAQRGLATCVKVAATTWVISGAGLT